MTARRLGHDDDRNPVIGMIPVGYAPSSVVLDTADNALLVANDKGIGTTGFQNTPPENSTTTSHGSPAGLNTHQDLGIVSIVPVPNRWTLDAMTQQVFQNNHWDLTQNIRVGRPEATRGPSRSQSRRGSAIPRKSSTSS